MYVKKSLLLWAAVFALALPLLFAGTAMAKYMGDGAVQDGTTGGWITPNDMICIVGVHADGTVDVADGVTNARDCIYLNKGTMNGGTAFDLSAIPTSALCTNSTNTYTGAKHSWATSGCWDASGNPVSLKGLDRTTQMCTAKGGTWVTSGKCVAYGRQFRGIDASGANQAFGSSTKGTDASQNLGFCYTTMRTGVAVASCPTVTGNTAGGTKTATSVEAFGYSVSGSNCTYAYGVNGAINAAVTSADGSTTAAGSVVDLTAKTTMGDCLAAGYSWQNWIPKGTLATIGTGTFAIANGAMAFDLTRQVVDADEGCLHCHSSLTEYNGPAEREKDSFLKTGHKNMLRKVTAGKNWAGPNAAGALEIYNAYASGTLTFGTSTIPATAKVSGADKPLLYLFGDWMAPAPAGLDVIVNMGATGAKYNGTSNYSCAPCHTQGWSNASAGLCSNSSQTTQASCTGTWYPMVGVQGIGTPGYAGTQPVDSFPSITFTGAGVWDVDGITCGRCHNATVPVVTAAQITQDGRFPTTPATSGGMGSVPGGPPGTWATNLCFGCHQSIAKTSNGTGLDADLAHPENLPVKFTGTTPGFSGHVIGGSFLNSPHARATATIVPNSVGKYDISTATYNSNFKGYTCWQSSTSSSPAKTMLVGGETHEIKNKTDCETLYGANAWRPDTKGSCVTCHDVHQSMFVAGQEGLRKECVSCHDNTTYAAAVPGTAQATAINHPTTPGTPAGIDPEDPCVVCHMPKPTPADFPMHVWRINSDPAYSTFPTKADFDANIKKIANTAADGTYANAVWVDIDLACGQCHGGTAGAGATKYGAPYKTKAVLAAIAKTMHNFSAATNAAPVVSNASFTVGATGPFSVSFVDNSSDADGNDTINVTVNWGDGNQNAVFAADGKTCVSNCSVETKAQGSVFSHTYTRGKTYTIYHSVSDGSKSANEKFTATVPLKYTVSGNVSSGVGTYLSLKKNGHTVKAMKATGGTYTFSNVVPGNYTIKAYKRGVTFTTNATVIPVTNANATLNIQ